MSIWCDKDTRVVVQNITGRNGRFHTAAMRNDGTNIVAGAAPGKGGQEVEGVPVFDTVFEAVEETQANASIIFVPAPFAADAILEAADAGVKLVVAITEGIPTLDVTRIKPRLQELGVRLIGPNCPGIITPGATKLGIMPAYIHTPGGVGVVSRSGTLTYEVVHQLTALGLGQSTCIGIGGDPIVGTNFIDALAAFQEDEGTDAMFMVGEIGGSAEERAAAFIKENVTKPVGAFIAGRTAPPGKRMGHAGAIIAGGKGTATDKIAALKEVGVEVAESPADMGAAMQRAIAAKK